MSQRTSARDRAPHDHTRALRGFSFLVGGTLLIAVVAAALHFSEWREFVRITQEAHPWWLILPIAFQASTYLAHGQIGRNVLAAAGFTIAMPII